ncbi:MAG: diacylglycerol kinase family lipid kinase [Bacteroidales bacterium]|nr:diacylglycerol kinase family lipid kinase [Bacteroidales bacterium]MDY0254256.1 diacylglycerol kinase family lipid kinase [Tenuifilaceae bacterium]
MKDWFVIINPEAGSGRGERDWPAIKALLEKHLLKFDFVFTQRKHHAVEITVRAIRGGYRKIICVGGDGTHNEIVNGVFIQQEVPTHDVTIATVAVGTGNDWAKTFFIPEDYEACILAIKEGNTFVQDVGKVEYFEARVKQARYFANAAGVGFDADVAKATNRLKEDGRKGRLLYLVSMIKTLVVFRSSAAKLQIDGAEHGGEFFSVTLGIGKYNGGGMMQTPNALPGDGLFDVTLIRRVNRLNVLWNVFKLYNGKILRHSKVVGHKAASVRITAKPSFNLEADGESLGTSPFVFKSIPKSIRVVVGADFSNLRLPQAAIYTD